MAKRQIDWVSTAWAWLTRDEHASVPTFQYDTDTETDLAKIEVIDGEPWLVMAPIRLPADPSRRSDMKAAGLVSSKSSYPMMVIGFEKDAFDWGGLQLTIFSPGTQRAMSKTVATAILKMHRSGDAVVKPEALAEACSVLGVSYTRAGSTVETGEQADAVADAVADGNAVLVPSAGPAQPISSDKS